VRDPVLNEALQRLAVEAATRFSTLVATGDEIPFDVAEEAGESTLFYRYLPLTARFVTEREEEVRGLASFGVACGAVNAAGVAAPYLEARGLPVPADPDERAAAMLVVFVATLWDGCAEFSLDRPRLEQALSALDAEAREPHEAELLIAPIVGLQMPLHRLELPSGVRVVRADTVDAPLDAMRSEGMQRAAWEPQFLAVAEQGDGVEGSLEAMRQLRELVSVLRLFKEGGVGLGPYAFAPTGEGKWRRLATGAAGIRPGGYKLSEAEAAELAELGRRLEAQPDPDEALRWAISRFEMGCERVTALEGLSDQLLALRAMLEGDGRVDATLPVRAVALVAEPGEQEEARSRIERAFELERSLMTGAEVEDGEDAGTALGLAVWIEDGVRALVRDAALGALRENLAEAADEALIRSGLETGEAAAEQRGGTAEWDAVPESPEHAEALEEGRPLEEGQPEERTRILEPAPETEDEIRITAWTRAVSEGESTDDVEEDDDAVEPEPEQKQETEMSGRDWLSEVGRDATLEWPASKEERRPQDRERIDSPRVRHLFPVPDDADWEIGELEYDRHNAGVR
jgi:hypothetical protein